MEPIYVVLFINLIVWGGIFTYIYRINNELEKLKKRLKKVDQN